MPTSFPGPLPSAPSKGKSPGDEVAQMPEYAEGGVKGGEKAWNLHTCSTDGTTRIGL